MDFQIAIHSVNARTPKHTAPWFVKVRTDAGYLYKTRALTGVDLEFREKFDFAEWDPSIKLEVWKSESSGVEFSLIAVVPLDFPNAGSYSTSFDLFSEKSTGKCKSSNSALLPPLKSTQNTGWRDPIAHVKVTVVHLSGFKARSIARLKNQEEGGRPLEKKAIPEEKTATQSMMKPKTAPPMSRMVTAPATSPRGSAKPPPLPVKPKWEVATSEEGDEYFRNVKTGETTWDRPHDYDGP